MEWLVVSLRWSDVDPTRIPFDVESVRAAVAARVDAAAEQRRDPERRVLEELIDRDLVVALGPWASGWRWSAGEPGGGGPVRGWCCAEHSLLRPGDASPGDSVDRVLAALTDWRAFLVDLERIFEENEQAVRDLPLEELVERTASRLLPLVLERTGAEDAWYATFARVVSWSLERAGLDPDELGAVLTRTISGRFASWVAPDEATAAATCAEIGRSVVRAAEEPASHDALAAWRSVRPEAFPVFRPWKTRERVRADAHWIHVETVDRARSAERADRLGAALDACRASAKRGEPLTLEALTAWQAIVLGSEAPFRGTAAFAKGGRERYPYEERIDRKFRDVLAQAESDEHVAVRAARVYLDVCFFHPFEDGNARAARLALDHVVTRAGLGLHAVAPLFVVQRSAGDLYGPLAFARALDSLLGTLQD